DVLRGPHPSEVLDRTADPHGDVELGRDGLPRLSNLVRVRTPAGVNGGARGAHGCSQDVSQLLNVDVILGAAHPAATADDDAGLRQLRTLTTLGLELDHARPRLLDVDVHLFNLGDRISLSLSGRPVIRADRRNGRLSDKLDR